MAGFKTRQLQGIYKGYEAEGLPLPASMNEVAQWAIQTGRWKASASIEVSVCARELSRALREEYIIDGAGRHVRVKHPVFVKLALRERLQPCWIRPWAVDSTGVGTSWERPIIMSG